MRILRRRPPAGSQATRSRGPVRADGCRSSQRHLSFGQNRLILMERKPFVNGHFPAGWYGVNPIAPAVRSVGASTPTGEPGGEAAQEPCGTLRGLLARLHLAALQDGARVVLDQAPRLIGSDQTTSGAHGFGERGWAMPDVVGVA